MTIQKFFLSAIALLATIDTHAQPSITSRYNGYRDGDKLYRIVANSTSLGDRGENCVWKLPSAQNDGQPITQKISLRNDSLTIVEDDLMLHFKATGQSLSMCGFQTRDMYCIQNRPLTELKYPFAYGDSISDTISRQSTYYNMYTMDGKCVSYTVCDGWGVLTDGNQTLKDVLRVHHHTTTFSKHDNVVDDSVRQIVSEVSEDKYLWYYSGCRYPVMDTRVIKCKENGETISDTTFTSLYMPELQFSELAYDDANYQLIAQRDHTDLANSENDNSNDDKAPFPVKMSATLQANNREIILSYKVSEDTKAAFYAYDLAGRMLGSIAHASLGKGEYQETMVLKERPINSIVMLTMVAGDRQQVVKVL